MKITKREMRHTLSYVEFDKIAVTIVDDDELDLACVVFHDVSDGWEFGQLLATQILLKYLEANNVKPIHFNSASSSNLNNNINGSNNNNNTNNNINSNNSNNNNNNHSMNGSGHNSIGSGGIMIGNRMGNNGTSSISIASSAPTSIATTSRPSSNNLTQLSFHNSSNSGNGGSGFGSANKIEYNIEQSVFHTKLSDAFKSMTLPIMFNLQQQRGIEKAAFVSAHNSNNKVLSSIFADWNLEAFLGHLISTSNDLVGGTPQSIVIEGDATNIQVIQVAPSYHLVCYVLKNIDPKIIEMAIHKAVKLLRQVHDLLTHTHSVK